MPQAKIERLISTLNQSFGDGQSSSQQAALLKKVEEHIHPANQTDIKDPNFRETLELLVEEIKDDHPAAAAIGKEVLVALGNMGI